MVLKVLNQSMCFHRQQQHHTKTKVIDEIEFILFEFRCSRCDKLMWGDAEIKSKGEIQ